MTGPPGSSNPTPRTGPGCSSGRARSAVSTPARSSTSTSPAPSGRTRGSGSRCWPTRGRGAHAPRPLVDPRVRVPRARRPPDLPRPGVVDARRGHPALPELGPGRVGRRGSLREPAAVDRRTDPGGRGVCRGRPLRVGADAVVAPARGRGPTAVSSPSSPSAATTCTTSSTICTTCATAPRPRRSGPTTAPRRSTATATADLPDPVAAAIGRFAGGAAAGAHASSRSGAGRGATPPRSRRPACGSGVRTSRPPSSRCCGPTGTTPTCSTRCTTTWPTLLRPARRTTAVWAERLPAPRRRDDLPTVLSRLADATRPGGLLYASLKEGDGESWSVHGNVSSPRRFTYWREERPAGRARRRRAGRCEHVGYGDGRLGTARWLEVLATRR